ncbi:SIR2 family protein [Caldimonas thermodepolymerans]|uniref:SIR2 family protein n=1 Tax=Caldimonas thermodepolymerans TaxID=215580 RepID=UPI002235CF8B|nr:SIR2 family protein [Caldimonas thermodepolymerans]UZG43719.1 SIR2 family protein [Caldimonas thermodepolymerans]
MTEEKKNAVIASFKPPRPSEWKSLQPEEDNEESEKRARQNQDELHNVLLSSLQMQHLVVLAGSGCSVGAGGPRMSDLWNEIVGANPEDDVREVIDNVGYDIKQENIEALLSRIEASLALNEDKALSAFLHNSKQKILNKCSGFLANEEKLEAHKTFVHRLSRRRARDQRLKIFTTNYDLCFESAAGALGIVVIDGFSFSYPRRFDPRFFDQDIVRRPRNGSESATYLEGVFLLYKLHGSVNWANKGNGNVVQEASPEPHEACLIYPAAGKYQQSFRQPHLELMAQYMASVREPNTCIIVTGFGFNDDHLSEPLMSAVNSNPHLRLIVVDPSAKERLVDGNEHWRRLGKLNEQGEDVWLISADFNQFAQLIPDLRSLSPADALVKAIRGVATAE